ncbi:hypothetical protein QUF80_10445 [Desulfococcaceae bacterium HSG8]|nr:hypothetical protein [Desulfococcaceae bacterium HSG8]
MALNNVRDYVFLDRSTPSFARFGQSSSFSVAICLAVPSATDILNAPDHRCHITFQQKAALFCDPGFAFQADHFLHNAATLPEEVSEFVYLFRPQTGRSDRIG